MAARFRLRAPGAHDAGFTMVESLIALSLTLVVTSAAINLATPATSSSAAQPELTDLQQRARVAADVLARRLNDAGAGVSAGPNRGALVRSLPPVVPRRLGWLGADAPGTARADVVSILSVDDPFAGAELGAPLAGPGSLFVAAPRPGCAAPSATCGLTTGDAVLVFDQAGRYATFTLTGTGPADARLSPRHANAGYPFAAGSTVASATSHTYYFDAAAQQLRHYDGYLSDTPVVDHVVAFGVEYLGQPSSPIWPRPPVGVANCLYDDQGTLAALPTLPSWGASLAPLPLASLADGPWCVSGDTRFDADLLRVRTVRISLRLEAVASSARGRGAEYARQGSSTSVWSSVPDVTITFDVTPRNLGLGR